MKKLERSILVIALPILVVVTLFNLYVLVQFHKSQPGTTLILNEKIYNKHSGSRSENDRKNAEPEVEKAGNDAKKNGVNSKNRYFDDAELAKKSGNEEQNSKDLKRNEHGNTEPLLKEPAIDSMIEKLIQANSRTFFPSYFWNISLHNLTRKLGAAARRTAKTLAGYETLKTSGELPVWKLVHRNIRQFSLYDPDDPNLEAALQDLATLPITECDENDGGTQLKINVRLSNEGRAVLKPMRYGREVEADENRYIFDDMERHIAEIAAFQLDKLLGFYRVPPTIGRKVNITSELKSLVPKAISKTFFTSPAGNLCFFGNCDYYCDSAHAFCGHPDVIEASIQMYLPSRNIAKRKSWYQPWRRSYSKFRKAYWELHDDLCNSIRQEAPYNNGKLLLDMIDAHTFDFLTGNKDRHSFATFKEFGNYTFPIMYDNGRGFGRQTYDAMSILAPLRQCCIIRKSTLLKYIKLYIGPEHLGTLMDQTLSSDPVAPVLIQPHLDALDRRLVKVLLEVAKCIENHPINNVVIHDRF